MFFFFLISKNTTISLKTDLFFTFIIYMEAQKVKYKFDYDHLTIEFFGDIDDHCAKKLRNDIDTLISSNNPRVVIFDFKNVSFVDSTGIGLIFGRFKLLSRINAELLLKNIPNHVDKIFRSSGVYAVCPKI